MYIKLHDLQFGFTKGGGCDKALLVFQAVVEYFNKHGSTVYVSTLDLTKAYERLNQCILCGTFRLLCKHICSSALTCTSLRSGDRSRDRIYINV